VEAILTMDSLYVVSFYLLTTALTIDQSIASTPALSSTAANVYIPMNAPNEVLGKSISRSKSPIWVNG
jgi:hypothetical protein